MSQILKIGLFLLLAAGVATFAYKYWSKWSGAEQEIEQVKQERKDFEDKSKALQTTVDDLTKKQQELTTQIAIRDEAIKSRDEQMADIKARLAKAVEAVMVETSSDQIFIDFQEAFGLNEANVKKITLNETASGGFTARNEFLAVPVPVSKLMINSKKKQVACEEVSGLQDEVRKLQEDNRNLLQQKLGLEEAKSRAFADGYAEATNLYGVVSDKYVALLSAPPKVELGPRWMQLASGFLGGVAVCGFAR